MSVRGLAIVLSVMAAGCNSLTESERGLFGARTNGFEWTASVVEIQRSGGMLRIEGTQPETLTGITLEFPESLGLHELGPGSPLFLSYFGPGFSWSASGTVGSIRVNVTELTSEGLRGAFDGTVRSGGNARGETMVISAGAFELEF